MRRKQEEKQEKDRRRYGWAKRMGGGEKKPIPLVVGNAFVWGGSVSPPGKNEEGAISKKKVAAKQRMRERERERENTPIAHRAQRKRKQQWKYSVWDKLAPAKGKMGVTRSFNMRFLDEAHVRTEEEKPNFIGFLQKS